ncbi:hypothetical protein TIFTF001_004351 [Ficus carica]|uniref:Uncharacterized protein n=1 Tax=Ficus carica TaxID=3494 RepID=A0AA87ZXN4_FICCA|nr:hypothetical protein TIFTF001_004351 [Ficus carica]
MSIEAMAMAGIDYSECGIDTEDWELGDRELPPPVYLLADQQSSESYIIEAEDKREMIISTNMVVDGKTSGKQGS